MHILLSFDIGNFTMNSIQYMTFITFKCSWIRDRKCQACKSDEICETDVHDCQSLEQYKIKCICKYPCSMYMYVCIEYDFKHKNKTEKNIFAHSIR